MTKRFFGDRKDYFLFACLRIDDAIRVKARTCKCRGKEIGVLETPHDWPIHSTQRTSDEERSGCAVPCVSPIGNELVKRTLLKSTAKMEVDFWNPERQRACGSGACRLKPPDLRPQYFQTLRA